MTGELYENQPTLGIPKETAVPLIVLVSVCIAALTAVLIVLSRQEK